MKVGDLVKNKNRRRYSVGLVTAIGYAKKWTTWLEAEGPNPVEEEMGIARKVAKGALLGGGHPIRSAEPSGLRPLSLL